MDPWAKRGQALERTDEARTHAEHVATIESLLRRQRAIAIELRQELVRERARLTQLGARGERSDEMTELLTEQIETGIDVTAAAQKQAWKLRWMLATARELLARSRSHG